MASHTWKKRGSWRLRPQPEVMESRELLSLSMGPSLALAHAPAPAAEPTSPAWSRLLVKFRPETAAGERDALLAGTGSVLVQAFPEGPSIVETPAGEAAALALARFLESPLVVYAEPSSRIGLTQSTSTLPAASPVYPNDPLLGQQWGLNSSNDVDIDAPEAWSVTTGSRSTIVAVLDSGLDLRNPDFAGRVWVNPAASRAGSKVYGWNFTGNNGNVQDRNGHGTHVTGIVAASGNNGFGVDGVNWRAQIMPLKILDADGSGNLDDAVSAVYFAANHGARVINASWGAPVSAPAMADAIRYANSKGVVFVTAAGNDGENNDLVPTYPANYNLPNILVVAAVTPGGGLASFSNYGARTVDLGAPGTRVLSTYPRFRGNFARLDGTSMAAPYVTGVVSLLAGLHPDWTARQLIDRVMETVKPLASLAGKTVSGGMVDAARALGVAGSGLDGNHYPGPPRAARKLSAAAPIHGRARKTRKPPRAVKSHPLHPRLWTASPHVAPKLARNQALPSADHWPRGLFAARSGGLF